MASPEWQDGVPSLSLTLTPSDCLAVVTHAATAHAETMGSADRLRVSLALEWLNWKVSQS